MKILLNQGDFYAIGCGMQQDPIFKERFGISTPIRYLHDVIVDPKYKEAYEKAWKKFRRETKQVGSVYRRKRFDAVLRRIHRLKDDLPYTKRVAIRYINKDVGCGVFAKKRIPPYSILNSYAGIIMPDKLVSPDHDSTFTFSDFPEFSIDAAEAGNWCRFMNHSPEGSSQTNVVAWEHYSKWGPRIIFTACNKGIKKGAQLLYSYGDIYWEDDGFKEL